VGDVSVARAGIAPAGEVPSLFLMPLRACRLHGRATSSGRSPAIRRNAHTRAAIGAHGVDPRVLSKRRRRLLTTSFASR
jgi:hypothetical protein